MRPPRLRATTPPLAEVGLEALGIAPRKPDFDGRPPHRIELVDPTESVTDHLGMQLCGSLGTEGRNEPRLCKAGLGESSEDRQAFGGLPFHVESHTVTGPGS